MDKFPNSRGRSRGSVMSNLLKQLEQPGSLTKSISQEQSEVSGPSETTSVYASLKTPSKNSTLDLTKKYLSGVEARS